MDTINPTRLRVAFAGDSYTSGGYQPWTCRGVWPQLFELAGYELNTILLARPGARTEHIGYYPEASSSRLEGVIQTKRRQASRLQLAGIPDGTALVTVTIGGGDCEYIGVLLGASRVPIRGWGDPRRRIDSLAAAAFPKLVRCYASLRRRVGPSGTVVAIGYPNPFSQLTSSGWVLPWFSHTGQQLVQYANEKLRQANQAAAKVAGVHFLDPTGEFIGHGVGAREEWIRGVVVHAIPGVRPMPFHLTDQGHIAYARLLREFLTGMRDGWPMTAYGLPANPQPASNAQGA